MSGSFGLALAVGMVLVIVLVLLGLGTLFIVPWVGAGLLVVAVITGVVVLGGSLLRDGGAERDAPVDTALPGPGDPRSAVDTGAREL